MYFESGSISDRKGRLEMGWKLLMFCHFLWMGVKAASLDVWGTEPELKEELMTSLISEEIAERQSLARLDEMGSRPQVEFLIPTIKLDCCILAVTKRVGPESLKARCLEE